MEWDKSLTGPIKDECGVEHGIINSKSMELKYDWAYQDEFGVEQGTIDSGEWNKTIMGPIKDECGVGQCRIYFWEWNTLLWPIKDESGVEH